MSLPKPIYGSILVTVIVLALALIAGNATSNVQAAPVRAVETAAAPQAQRVIGQVTGTTQPGDTVRVTQGETLIGEAVAETDGAWLVPIPQSAAPATPFHVQITPAATDAAQRGAQPEPDGPITIWVSVVIGSNKVEVRVQVISPNGQVDIEVLAPIDPCNCETPEATVQAQPTAQSTAQPTTEPTYHRVRSGETLAIIAARYGVTTQALMQANKLRNPNLIFAGQRLVIPK